MLHTNLKILLPFARDKIFGSIGTAFQYKWKGIGYAHPHNEEATQQTIQWARLVAIEDPNTITIVVIPNTNWYRNFLAIHRTIPIYTRHYPLRCIYNHVRRTNNPQVTHKPKTKPLAIQILCIHHQTRKIGTLHQINNIKTTIDNLQIPQYHIQTAQPTPQNTPVNKNKTWYKNAHPPSNHPNTLYMPPLPNFTTNTMLKFQPQHSYYTDGSFIPPTQIASGH